MSSRREAMVTRHRFELQILLKIYLDAARGIYAVDSVLTGSVQEDSKRKLENSVFSIDQTFEMFLDESS